MSQVSGEESPIPADAANSNATQPVFIITAYRSFNGRAKNGSETLLNALRSQPILQQVQFHALDVGWKKVDEFKQKNLNGKNIRGIIGLGEGHPGLIAIELYGKNAMAGTDEYGVDGKGSPIADGKPQRIRSRFHYALNDHIDYQHPVLFSTNAGDFLCNYLLYHCNDTAIPISGFIHVPPQGDAPDALYLKSTLNIVLDMVQQNVTAANITPLH